MNESFFFASQAEVRQLPGGGSLHYWPAWLDTHQADSAMTILTDELPWEQPEIVVYGRSHKIPRKQSWHGDPGRAMVYSGTRFLPKAWHPLLQTLREKIESTTETHLNTVLVNLYRNGNDGMGWHSDNERELGNRPRIASLSLGATRNFAFRRRGETKTAFSLPLQHGDLLLMGQGVQTNWEHALPKTKRCSEPRINLTFRNIVHADLELEA